MELSPVAERSPERSRARRRSRTRFIKLLAAIVFLGIATASFGSQGDLDGVTVALNPAAITTFAGNGSNATFDGTGTGAAFREMGGAVILNGSAYVGTSGSIRRVNLTTGEVTTLAGHPTIMDCVNGATGATSRFSWIYDLTTDGTYLYTSEQCYGVRKVSLATGATSLVASPAPRGKLTMGPDGNIYVGDYNQIKSINPSTGVVSTFHTLEAGASCCTSARWLAADGTNLWVTYNYPYACCSSYKRRLKKIPFSDPSGATLVQEFGEGTGPLVSAGDYLYLAMAYPDYGTLIKRFKKSDNSSTNVAGTRARGYVDATGTDAWFSDITGIASDGTNLWIADSGNFRLRKAASGSALPAAQSSTVNSTINLVSAAITTFAGDGVNATYDATGTDASFKEPQDVVAVGGYAYMTTLGAIRKVNIATGEVSIFVGHPTQETCVQSGDASSVRQQWSYWITTDGYYLYWYGCGGITRTSLATGATSLVTQEIAGPLTFGPDGYLYVIGQPGGGGGPNVYRVDPIAGTASVFYTLESGWNYPSTAMTVESDSAHIWVNYQYNYGCCPSWRYQIKKIPISNPSAASTFRIETSGLRMGDLQSAGDYLYAVMRYNDYEGTMIRRFAKADASFLDVAGGSIAGYADGVGAAAQFRNISGLGSDGRFLWIVDGKNGQSNIGNFRFRVAGNLPLLSAGFANLGRDGYSGWAEDVNVPIGNFVHTSQDIDISSVGPDLEVSRTYNSLDQRIGAFGRGWSFNYEMLWQPGANDSVIVLYPDGRREVHTRQGGTYSPPAGYFSKLTSDGSGGFRLTNKEGMIYAFGSNGRLNSLTDENGRSLNLTYDGAGKLSRAADVTSSRGINFTWTGDYITQAATDSVGAHAGPLVWKYYYSGNKLVKACDPRNNADTGSCITYTYTGQALSLVARPRGNTEVEVAYQSDGKVDWRKNGLGNLTNLTYVSKGIVDTTDPRGNATRQENDGKYRLTKETDPFGNTTTYQYDSKGNRSSITDANSATSTMAYDTRGNLTSKTDGEGKTAYMSYDSNDNLTVQRDPRSASSTDNTYATTFEYDAAGNKTKETAPATAEYTPGVFNRWTYTTGAEAAIGGGSMPAGLLRTSVDARSNTVTYSYDSPGDLREVVDAVGLKTTYIYDEIGRKLSEKVISDSFPSGVGSTFSYDVLGNLLTVTAPELTNPVSGVAHQQKTTNEYDGNSNLTKVTGADLAGGDASRVTEYTYDNADRQTSVKDPELGILSRTFDAASNVLTVTDQEGRVTKSEYDSKNLLTKVTLENFVDDPIAGSTPRDLIMTTWTYDSAGRKVSETDALGRRREWTYDKVDRATKVVLKSFVNRDATTRHIVLEEYTYDAAGNALTEKSGDGKRRIDHTYDESGRRQTSTLDPLGLSRVTTYDYDADGNVTKATLSGGGTTEETRLAFDAGNRKTSETVENGATDLVTTFAYDQRGGMLSKVDPRGNLTGADPATFRTNYEYDELGRLIKTLLPTLTVEENGGSPSNLRPTVELGYNTFGNQTHSKDPRSKITVTSYDKLGRRTSITHPNYVDPDATSITPTESFTYDDVGNLISRTDRRAKTTDFTFDKANRVVRQLDPLLSGEPSRGSIRYSYDDAGNATSVTDQRGAKTEWTYDMLNRARTQNRIVRRPSAPSDNYTTALDYDDLGNETFVQGPSGETTTSVFSPASEMTSQTDPATKTTSFSYDLASREVRRTDPLGRYSEGSYDLAGRLIATKNYSSSNALIDTTSFGYDASGNQTTITTPRGKITTLVYDAANRLKEVTEPISPGSSMTTRYTYDASGNQTSLENGEGHKTILTYQSWNLPEHLKEPSTTAHPLVPDRTLTTLYDAGGLPTSERQPGGVTINRTFDELGRLKVESASGGGATAASRSFSYDLGGLRTAAAHPSGTQTFVYDDRRLLTESSGPSGASSFVFDASARMTERTDPSGTSNFTWSPRGDLSTATDPLTGVTRTYSFDDAAQMTEVKYGPGSVPTRTLSYDQRGRLTSDTLKDSSGTTKAAHSYGYDLDSNLTTQTINLAGNSLTGAHSYSYDDAGRIDAWGRPDGTTLDYEWDKAGNRTKVGEKTFAYDQRNRLVSETEPVLGLPGVTTSKDYSYTSRGTLSEIKQRETPVTLSTYGFDSLSRLGAYHDPLSDVTYTYDSLDRIAERGTADFTYAGFEIDPTTDGAFTYSRSPSGRLQALTNGTQSLLAGMNRHGDLAYLFDSAASLTDTKVYDPFGTQAAETGSTDPNLGYQGDYTDPASARVWMGSRWYGPNEAQFLSRDTVFGMLQTPISLNRYTYANGDPLDYFDPDGHLSCRVEVCQKVKRAGQKVARGTKQVVRAATGQVKTAAAAVGETIQIQAGRAQHKMIAGQQRVAKTFRRAVATTKANLTQARQSVGRLQTKIADTQIGGARLRDWGAAYADEQTARDAIGGLKSLSPPNMYRSLEAAGGEAVDEYIAATGHIPTDNYTLFNVAANPAYRMLDKCTGDVTGFSAGGCAMGVLETVGTALALEQTGKVAIQATRAALGSTSKAAVTQTTKHGAQRLAAEGFDEEIIQITKAQGQIIRQADGATVYLRQVSPGRYDFIVEGQRGVITAHRNMPQKAVEGLAKNYGWEGWP